MNFESKYPADINSGRLNSDDAAFAIGKNEWVNMENIRTGSTDAGVTGTMESVGSTTLLSSPSPSVSFICIGSVSDQARDRMFYFLYNKQTSEHKIACYNEKENRFYNVLLSSQVEGGLNFSKDYPIHSASVVIDMLYWTDNYNPPRRINVEAGIKLNDPSYQTQELPYQAPIEQSVISIMRRAPGTPAIATVTSGASGGIINSFSGQFAFRYTYRDGEVSPFGPPSNMVVYPEGTNGFIIVSFSRGLGYSVLTSERILQDVLVVELAVRYNNTTPYFIIKKWDKRDAADAAIINNFNAGISDLFYNFYNNQIGEPVSDSDSIRIDGGVPLLSETLETASGRLFLGNNLIGYNTPTLTSLQASTATSSGATAKTLIFKSYSSYQIGLRFRDGYKRQSGVVTNDSLIVNIPDRDYNFSSYVTGINWTLSNANAINEIPDWAIYVDILITKCLRTRFFAQAKAAAMQYVTRDANGAYVYSNTYAGNEYALGVGASLLNGLGLGYSYAEGDIIRLYVSGVADPYSLSVIGQDGFYILVQPVDLGSFAVQPSIVFEIYTPYGTSDNEFFYTIQDDDVQHSFLVLDPGTNTRTYSITAGTIDGDTYRVQRTQSVITPYFTETMSPVDKYWKDWFRIFGEANIRVRQGQIRKYTSVKWSNVLIEGTEINGLSTFEPLNEKLLPIEMDALRKLQLTSKTEGFGVIMLAIAEKETASLYLGEVQTYGSNEISTLVVSEQVIGTVNIMKGSYGTSNPESVCEYRGRVFWVDVNRGRVIQYSVNGLDAISNYKMTRFWKQFSDLFSSLTPAQIEALGGRPFIFSTVDPRHDELLLSIPTISATSLAGGLPEYESIPDQTVPIINMHQAFWFPALSDVMEYYGQYVYLENVVPAGWYVRSGTEIYQMTNPPTPVNPPSTYPWSELIFRGATLEDVTANVRPPGDNDAEPINPTPFGTDVIIFGIKVYTDSPFDIFDGKGKTIVFSLKFGEGAPRWQGSYSFNPENFITLNNELYSFKDGQLYIHNDESSVCNFYGVQYKSRIMVVANENPKRPKVFQNISVEANMRPSLVKMYNNYPYEQISDLVDYDFKDKEGVFYALVLRNKIQPTAEGYNLNGLLTGEKMRNVAMLMMFEFSPTTDPLELKFINIGYDISRGHTT